MKAMKAFISVLALILVGFVVIGFALPGSWSAERTRLVRAPVEDVFPYLEDLTRWQAWSSMAQVEGTLSDPPRGAGATLTWDDPQWGDGEFRITEVSPLREVRYRVAVEDGSIRTEGWLRVSAWDGGTEIAWREEGDVGWNPLMAWFALGMERMQGAELEKALDRLQALLEG